MKSVRTCSFIFFNIFFCFNVLTAELEGEGQESSPPLNIKHCARCEEAREYNRTHPNEYFYYEDYLESKSEKKKGDLHEPVRTNQ